ncbi:TrkA C-terminal domain-containing protein [Planctomicrobium sp.]|jgi:hypothetical protein|nr:TrkA C-terminal domain-containing protein [Planctomicrobium sp.]MBT5020009.1 TrkA C-terminal domain-containing protein [Planctomicrobium sp.]MDA7503586.1 TrkA C-terminal domain-containing protein [bacterium]MDB4743284.1 TrkA C-terminal domain-containing protein [Planctomicrobium sp.]
MVAIVSLLVVIVISMLIVKVATVALTLTGISEQLARFQARSAFTGSGFTTNESEQVVSHPVRRRIIMMLMLLGNAGIVTAMSSLMLSFTNSDSSFSWTFKLLALFAGLVILWSVASSEWLNQKMTKLIAWALKKYTDLELRDYAGLLHLTGDYVVAEMTVNEGDWLCDQSLQELRLNSEGVLVLGIEKADGNYFGAPRGQTEVNAHDTLLLYGRGEVLSKLDERRKGARGNWDHHKSVDQQKKVELAELEAEEESEGEQETEKPTT